MTVRSILIGLAVGLGVAGFGYYNDVILSSTPVAGDLIPLAPYAMLVVGLLAVNPLLGLLGRLLGQLGLGRLERRLRLRPMSGGEWTVSLSLAMACVLMQGPGLTWTFTHILIQPRMQTFESPAWREKGVVSCIGHDMLVDPQDRPDVVLGGWRTGLGDGKSFVHPADVPWSAWAGPLGVYLPLLAMGVLGSVCLALILHRQWSHHERLSYPIAELTNALLDRGDRDDAGTARGEGVSPSRPAGILPARSGETDMTSSNVHAHGTRNAGETPAPRSLSASSLLPRPRLWPNVFYNRFFWLAFAPVLIVRLLNGANTWLPQSFFVKIPLRLELERDFCQIWPRLVEVPNYNGLLAPTVYFGVVAVAYFVSLEVSFTLGMAPILAAVVGAWLMGSGVVVSEGDYLSGSMMAWHTFGAFAGVTLLVLYTGRSYYLSLLRRSVGLRSGSEAGGTEVRRGEVWAFRLMVLLGVGMVAYMTWRTPLTWGLSTMFVALAGIAVLVVTRTSVETGLYFIQPGWHPVGVIIGALGLAALGPPAVGALMILTVVLALDPRIAMLPLAASALKIGERQGLSLPRVGGWMAGAGVLGLLAAVLGTLWVQYSFGSGNFWWGSQPPVMAFNAVERTVAAVGGQSDRLFDASLLQPNPRFIDAAMIGLGAVLLLSVLRLRLPWWPLHPVLLVVWVSFPAGLLWVSFLLGWMIKRTVIHLGGSTAYHRYKPFFVGLLAADLTAGALWGAFGPLYTFITNLPGVAVVIRP